MNGIDVSRWQPANITDLVDYDFVIIKATEGTSYVSPFCDQQYQAAKKRGKLLGVYHFASGLDPVAEANYFIDNCEGYIGEAVLVLDWEANAVSKGADYVRKFVRQVKARTNVPPIIYGSASPLSAHGIPKVAEEEDCGLWVAAYPNNAQTGYRDEPQLLGSVIRQYASTGRLSGYNGDLDLNRSILTPDQWKAYARGKRDATAPAPETVPTPIPPTRKDNDQIANEVIAGLWGNGEERKNKLSAAGYNPTDIQALVNTKLGGAPARKSNDQIATEVMGGLWGDNPGRQQKLQAAGYDYNAIQQIVNQRVGAPVQSQALYIAIPSGPAGYLGNIANQYGTTVAQLVSWNKAKYPYMSANYVQAGWVIRVR
jgi:lysozyme